MCTPGSGLSKCDVICRLDAQREHPKLLSTSYLLPPPFRPPLPPSLPLLLSLLLHFCSFLFPFYSSSRLFFYFLFPCFHVSVYSEFLKILLRNTNILALTNEYLIGLKCSPLFTLPCTVPQVSETIGSSVQNVLFPPICPATLSFMLFYLGILFCTTLAL